VRKALVLAGVAGLLVLTACGKEASGGSTEADVPPIDPPTSAAAATTSAAAEPVDPVLRPDGIGPYKLGGTPADATAAGAHLNDSFASPGCPNTADVEIPKGTVAARLYFSTKHGLSAIRILGDSHTPEGITNFSTLADVKKKYPKVKNTTGAANLDGTNMIALPGNPKASYRIDGFSGKVDYVYLLLLNNDCKL
jgi:hypothetical protein